MPYLYSDSKQYIVVTGEPLRAPKDLSSQVTRLARAIDRLPPGQYNIELTKQPEATWVAVISDASGGVVRGVSCDP